MGVATLALRSSRKKESIRRPFSADTHFREPGRGCLKRADPADRNSYAVKLTPQEVRELVNGATVRSVAGEDLLRTWKDAEDGTLQASASGIARPVGGSGKGVWRVADSGAYCVTIEWGVRTERWCRFIYRLGDQHYGVKSDTNPDAPALKMQFSK